MTDHHREVRRALGLAACCVAAVVGVAPSPTTASAQESVPTGPPGVEAPADLARAQAAPGTAGAAGAGVSPGGAFLRAVLVPGWGHAAIGSYGRGGFYFAAETATAYTLLRTRQRISEARAHETLLEGALRQDLAAEGVTDPTEIDARLEEDADLQDLRALVEAREQQQEDLVALGIFLLFLSGADAYVSAHLADFPAPISIETAPNGPGRMDVGLRLRLPR